jgi:hypothetical protein
MDQSQKKEKKATTGFAKVAYLAGKALKSKSQWTDKVNKLIKIHF